MRSWRNTGVGGTPCTAIVAAVTSAIFVGQRLSGVGVADVDRVRQALGFDRGDILHGQVWRLFTPNLVHAKIAGPGPPGFGHLFFNMAMLLVVGGLLERRHGARTFLIAFLLGGTAAYGWLVIANPDTFYATGASGSVFAVLGCLATLELIKPGADRSDPMRQPWRRLLIVVGVGAWFFALSSDPVAAHIHGGGLVAGVLIATVLTRRNRADAV